MKLVFLGTSSVFPTKDRAHSSIYLDIGPEAFLFDCGESVQRQITIAKLKPMKISKIFISHWHGDHVLGLPGLLESFQMNNRKKDLEIYGPKGTKEHFKHLLKAFEIRLGFKLIIKDITPKTIDKVTEGETYEINSTKMKHSVTTIAFSFKEKDRVKLDKKYLKKFGLENNPILKKLQQGKDITYKGEKIKFKDAANIIPGKKLTFLMDTAPIENAVKLAQNSDILISEATFLNDLKDMASKRGHLTAKQAAKIAKKAKAKQLIITHFSQRYKNIKPLVDEAKKTFKNTKAARDFLEVKL